MHPYEACWGALLDDVLCGRPEGHNGRCRSRQAISKASERARKNWPEYRARRQERRRLQLIPDLLIDEVEAAARQATEREMAKRTVNW